MSCTLGVMANTLDFLLKGLKNGSRDIVESNLANILYEKDSLGRDLEICLDPPGSFGLVIREHPDNSTPGEQTLVAGPEKNGGDVYYVAAYGWTGEEHLPISPGDYKNVLTNPKLWRRVIDGSGWLVERKRR